ncbi:MAG: GDSL-type esterase/lipase family protein, partial [Sciscionella sp.]
SQAEQLQTLARDNRVRAVIVAVGANDEPDFAGLLNACISAWFARGKGCSAGFEAQWRARIRAMQPKVVAALTDIRTAMRNAGYADGDYTLVLQSYAAPIAPDMRENLRNLSGCPFQRTDLRWVHDDGVTQLSRGLRSAATRAGARFLDLSAAGDGHEACTGGNSASGEWFTRLTVNWLALNNARLAGHALQSSFHPNAAGYAAFGHCMSEFLAQRSSSARCVAGADASLRAVSP